MTTLWIGFSCAMVGLVLLDLFLLRPRSARVSPLRSLVHAGVWLALAMLFALALHEIYERSLFSAGRPDSYTLTVTGADAVLQYLGCFLLEIALGLDTVLVITAIFSHARTPPHAQHRVLMYGMLLALVVRAAMILGVGAVLHKYEWVRFLLAVAILVATMRMILIRRENTDPNRNLVLRVLRKVFPTREESGDDALLSTRSGRLALTPLLGTVVLIETADAFLALDSVPANFALTREPFLIFTASAFALAVVRSALPALQLIAHRLRWFKMGVAGVLAFSAVAIALPARVIPDLPKEAALNSLQKIAFLAGFLAIGALLAWVLGPPANPQDQDVSPLGREADRFARDTLAGIRKLIILVVGITGVVLGAIMAIGPGPGIPVLFIALLILSAEFVWARRLVNKYRPVAERATRIAAEQTRRRMRPATLIAIMIATALAFVALALALSLPPGLVIAAAIPMLFGQALLGYLAFFRREQPMQQPGPTPPPSHPDPTRSDNA